MSDELPPSDPDVSGASSSSPPVDVPANRTDQQSGAPSVQSLRELIVGELLDGDTSDPQVIAKVARVMESHSGPMPDARTLRAYKEIDPRLVDEVLTAAKENRRHRYKMDLRLSGTARISLFATWSVVGACVVAAIAFAASDRPWPAALFGAAGIAPVLKHMILGGGTWTGRGRSRNDTPEE